MRSALPMGMFCSCLFAAAAGGQVDQKRLSELMAEDRLFGPGQPHIYRGENLGAIRLPVGGIGTGSIQIDGSAARPVWQIFNNLTQAAVPDSSFAVLCRVGSEPPVARALQTSAAGPFEAAKGLSFRGEYPFGWFTFEDPALPVQVTMETFNPLIPLDARSSGIPCAIYRLTAHNPTASPIEVSFLATQQNAVGYTGQGAIQGRSFADYGGNRTRLVRQSDATILHMTADLPPDAAGFGDMALAADDEYASASPDWASAEALAMDWLDDGLLSTTSAAGPSPTGQTLDGAMAVRFILDGGRTRTVTFALTWYFPNATHGAGPWGGRGNMYANWWTDALDVAYEVLDRLDELTAGTHLYHDSLYDSNLPHWLLDRIGSQVAILRSSTCFWARAGYFGGWEGCSPAAGCCHGNCGHVWHYAQAHARLFPEIARLMREQDFHYLSADGAVPHRQPNAPAAFDGQCGAILGAYREHLAGRDRAWLSAHWSAIHRAMDYTITRWDKDEDGVLAGPQWNTLDENLGGSTSWLGTLYLAALDAAEKMAAIQGDDRAAKRYRTIRQTGQKKQDQTLFNGQYYVQIPDSQPYRDYVKGCHVDQLLGQWWAHQLDLGWLYPPDHARTALKSLFKNNFRPRFTGIQQLPRKFVADDDAGLQMITWPNDPRPANHMLYADEVMTGFEYAAAAEMIYAGLLKEGFTVVRAVADRYDGRLRTGLTKGDSSSWGYSGNPFGDDECGKFYARAMSVWSLLLACQGFIYDGPAGTIGFKPNYNPRDHRSFFTTAEGYGLFTQTRTERSQTEAIELRSGTLKLKSFIFELPANVEKPQVTAHLQDNAIPASAAVTGSQVRVDFQQPLRLEPGQKLTLLSTW